MLTGILRLKNRILENEYIIQPIQLIVMVSFNTPELQKIIDEYNEKIEDRGEVKKKEIME